MAFVLELPDPLASEGWKVKIRDKERLEPPHVTIFNKRRVWRLGLRNRVFLIPPGGIWREIDERVQAVIDKNWQHLCEQWDQAYPTNPISTAEEDDNG